MKAGDTFYVGVSARTNEEGIRQFADFFGSYGYEVKAVPLTEVLHLKTGVNYIENNKMLVSGEFIDKPDFASYEKIIVPEEEAYGANCIWMNGTVIVPEGYDAVKKAVEDAGYPVILVDTSEFRKIDGGLSCLSLRF
jgi:dimethylargininase